MKLYYIKGACSLASYIALKEAKVPFEAAEVDRSTRMTSDGEDLNAINPKGYVPVLRLDNGQLLTENVAVLQYIADLNPSVNLAPPPGTFERYRLIEHLAFINSEVHKNFSPLFRPGISEDIKRFARDNLARRLNWLDSALGAQPFLMGQQFTVADAYLYVVLGWTRRVGIDLAQWPALKQHNERISQRAQVIAAQRAEGLE